MKAVVHVDLAGVVGSGSVANATKELKKQLQELPEDDGSSEESTNPSTSARLSNTLAARADSDSRHIARAKSSSQSEKNVRPEIKQQTTNDASSAASAPSRTTNASFTSSQREEMRRLLAHEKLQHEQQLQMLLLQHYVPPPSLVRSHHPQKVELVRATSMSMEDTISRMTESPPRPITPTATTGGSSSSMSNSEVVNSSRTSNHTQLFIERLLQAEEQTKQFQQEIQTLVSTLRSKEQEQQQQQGRNETDINQQQQQQHETATSRTTRLPRVFGFEQQHEPQPHTKDAPHLPPPGQVTSSVATTTSTPAATNTTSSSAKEMESLWERARVLRQRFAPSCDNSILEERQRGGVTATDDDTDEEQDEAADCNYTNGPTSSCNACEPWISAMRDLVGYPNKSTSETSVVGLQMSQLKSDQARKQKIRNLELENLTLRKTLRVSETATARQNMISLSTALTPVRRSCPGRVNDDGNTWFVASPSVAVTEDAASNAVSTDSSSAATWSNVTPDAILSCTTHTHSTKSSSTTVRPTKHGSRSTGVIAAEPRTVLSTSTSSSSGSSSFATMTQCSSHLEPVPENEELSSPPVTPPSDHQKRKYSLQELRERTKQARAVVSVSKSRNKNKKMVPPEAAATLKLQSRSFHDNNTNFDNARGRGRTKSKPFRGRNRQKSNNNNKKDVPDGSKWRMAFLERIEL